MNSVRVGCGRHFSKRFTGNCFRHKIYPCVSSSGTKRMSSGNHSTIASNGDLNNNSAARPSEKIEIDPTYLGRSLAISEYDDDMEVRRKYRPFILDAESSADDWTEKLELSTVMKMAEEDLRKSGDRLKVLVLFGSLRKRFAAAVPHVSYRMLKTQADPTLGCSHWRPPESSSGWVAMCGCTILQAYQSRTTSSIPTTRYKNCGI